MEDKLFEDLLFLLIIDKAEKFRNAYDLIKILSWKFGIFEYTDIPFRLKTKSLIEENIVGTMNHYLITIEGKDFLNKNIVGFKKEILNRYPDQSEFAQAFLG